MRCRHKILRLDVSRNTLFLRTNLHNLNETELIRVSFTFSFFAGISFTSLVFSLDLFREFSSTRHICCNDFQNCTHLLLTNLKIILLSAGKLRISLRQHE